jgi:hypothetical protein
MSVAIAFVAGAALPLVLNWVAAKRAKHAARQRRN